MTKTSIGIIFILTIALIAQSVLFSWKKDQAVLLSQKSYDSLVQHDKNKAKEIDSIKTLYVQDSFKLIVIEQAVDNAPQVITKIKYKFNEKRDSIGILPVNDQLLFFAKWLSSVDSLTK